MYPGREGAVFEAIGGFLTFAVTMVAGIGAFTITREFVRQRLRFVDAVRHPAVREGW
jgi:hypothetical protein